MTRCQCANERRQDTATKQFRWGGCSDNVKHGKRVARNFLELQPVDTDGDEATLLLRHDSEVGITAVMNSLGEKCKCHGKFSSDFPRRFWINFAILFSGVSGSCSMQTCWRKLSGFNTTSAVLRLKYHQAIRKISLAKASRRAANRERRTMVTIGTGFNGRNFPGIGFSESLQDNDYEQLFYLEQSPTFCAVTRGRQCTNPDNCSALC